MQKRFWRRSARAVVLLAAITPAMAQVRYPDLRSSLPGRTDFCSIAPKHRKPAESSATRTIHSTEEPRHWRFSRSITGLSATI